MNALTVCTLIGLTLGFLYLIYNQAQMWAEGNRKELPR